MKASLNWFASAEKSFVSTSHRHRAGTIRTLGVREADGKRLGLRFALTDVSGSIPDPAAVAADVGGELHVGDDCILISIRLN